MKHIEMDGKEVKVQNNKNPYFYLILKIVNIGTPVF